MWPVGSSFLQNFDPSHLSAGNVRLYRSLSPPDAMGTRPLCFSCTRLYCPNPISILTRDALATTYTVGAAFFPSVVCKRLVSMSNATNSTAGSPSPVSTPGGPNIDIDGTYGALLLGTFFSLV